MNQQIKEKVEVEFPHFTNTEQLIEHYIQGEDIEFLFFYGSKPAFPHIIDESCLSNWYRAPFTLNKIRYHTMEQYMMAEKARLFHDTEQLSRIMNADTAREAKTLGRRVLNFDDDQWKKNRWSIVSAGLKAKFTQNDRLCNFLLKTGKKVLVEASPTDSIWGIGMSACDKRTSNPVYWQGDNLLGFILMDVRQQIVDEMDKK